jgi:hypothetical protein
MSLIVTIDSTILMPACSFPKYFTTSCIQAKVLPIRAGSYYCSTDPSHRLESKFLQLDYWETKKKHKK